MKKFINAPDNIVEELLAGYALAYPDLVSLEAPRLVVNRHLDEEHRVALVSLGGSGHEPCACGYVGNGMLDVFAAGDIFVAPDTQAVAAALRRADRGEGVLLIVLNHAVDMLSARQAVELCRKEGMAVEMVVIQEDISTAPRSHASERRGLVGCVPMYKLMGAAAAQHKSLAELHALARSFSEQMGTLVVGIQGATHPVTKKLLSEFTGDEMEIGMGQHGEEGGGRQKLLSADETAVLMLNALIRGFLHVVAGQQVMLLLDGLGATTMMELFIVYRKCQAYLQSKKIEIVANYVGELLTVQDAAGFQMFMAKMDDQRLALWQAPCNTAYFKQI